MAEVACICLLSACSRGGDDRDEDTEAKLSSGLTGWDSVLIHNVTDSKKNAAPRTLKSTKSQNSDSSVQIQVRPYIQFEFVPLDAEGFEFCDSVDFGVVAFSLEPVILGYYL